MNDWETKLRVEKKDLDTKIGNLIKFLNDVDTGKNDGVVASQLLLLQLQLKYMKKYACCVNLRLDEK